MSITSLIFFIAFAAILFFMYIGIRRRIASPMIISAAGVLGSVVSMMLFSLSQGNFIVHAILVGLLVGGGLSIITLVIALYFHSQELRKG